MQVHRIVHDEPTSALVTVVTLVPQSLASPITTTRPPPPARAHLLFDAPVLPGIPNVFAAPVPNSAEGGAPAAAVVAASQEAAVTLAGELAVYCPERRPPSYPMASRQRRELGEVVLKVELAEDGAITSVEILASSGSPRLDDAARAAVLGWHCHPPKQGDRAVRAVAIQPIEFVLNRR
jgi:protein TonB